MKRASLRLHLVLIALASILVTTLAFHVYWLDGILGLGAELVIGETVYSKGYSEWKFRRIREGMTESEVKSIMGEPLYRHRREGDDIEVWHYSYGTTLPGHEWYVTNVAFSHRGVFIRDRLIITVFHNFYFD